MKKIIFFILIIMPFGLLAQTIHYKIKGHIDKYNSSDTVFLMLRNQKMLDSATMNNGSFVFKGSIQSPEPISAYVFKKIWPNSLNKLKRPVADGVNVYLENGIIQIVGDTSFQSAEVKGTELNNQQLHLRKMLHILQPASDSITAFLKSVPEKERISPSFKNQEKELKAPLFARQKLILAQFVRENPSSLISLVAIKDYGVFSQPEQEALFKGLNPYVKNSIEGKKATAGWANANTIHVGMMAPAFNQNDTLGKSVSLSDFRGKYVLVDFWASWCGPCRAENPNVVKAYNQYKDKNFTILGVSLDQPGKKQAWLDAIHKDGLWWNQVSDLKFWDNAAAKLYNVKGIPANFLIDPQGKIIAKNIRGEELSKKLEEILH